MEGDEERERKEGRKRCRKEWYLKRWMPEAIGNSCNVMRV